MSYFPPILITVVGKQQQHNHQETSVCRLPVHFVFTFFGTLQPLTLRGVQRGHFVGLAWRSADAGAVHSPDPEVVGVAHAQPMCRIFANLHWGVVALDPGVAAGLTAGPTEGLVKDKSEKNDVKVANKI